MRVDKGRKQQLLGGKQSSLVEIDSNLTPKLIVDIQTFFFVYVHLATTKSNNNNWNSESQDEDQETQNGGEQMMSEMSTSIVP